MLAVQIKYTAIKSEIPTQLENELQKLVKVRKHSEVGDWMSGLRWHKLYWKKTNPKETALLATELHDIQQIPHEATRSGTAPAPKTKMQISPAHMSLSNSFTSFLSPDKPEHLNPGKNAAAKPEARPQINLRLLKSNSTASALRKIQLKRRMLHPLANLQMLNSRDFVEVGRRWIEHGSGERPGWWTFSAFGWMDEYMDEQFPLPNWKLHPIGPVFKFEVCTMLFAFQCEGLQNNHTSLKLFCNTSQKTNLILAVMYWIWN